MNMKRWMQSVLALAVLLAPGLSGALIAPPVGVSSSATALVLGTGARGSLAWSVNYTPAVGPGTPVTVSSSQLVVRTLSGTVIETQARRLSRSATAGGTLSFPEAFSLSSAVAYRAYRLGSAGVILERSFVDSSNPGVTITGSTVLPLSTAPGSALLVARVDLRFDNASRATQVPEGTALRAIASVRAEGAGWLDARWEIADGSGRQGEPLYRPLRSFRQYVGGGLPIELESPPLPTQTTGRTLVRLAIREPAGTQQPEPLLYQVLGAPLREPLSLLMPRDDALLTPETRFEWREVEGARAYLVELLQEPGSPGAEVPPERDAAAMVPAPATEWVLSDLARNRLQPARAYRWRVTAIDEQGRVLSQSAPRRVQAP